MLSTVGDQAEIDGETGGAPPVFEDDNTRITGGEPPDNGEAARNGGALLRDAGGRFVPGTAAGAATRFAGGKSGNLKGRPQGSRRWLSRRDAEKFGSGARVAAALLDAEAERITRIAIEAALAGDAVAARFCLGRVLGGRRGQPVELDLPAVARARDLSGVVTAITGAVADGRVTPDEAHALSRMLVGLPGALAAANRDADEAEDREDPREALIRELDRIAADQALEQARALASIAAPARPLDVPVPEHQEQDEDQQQQPADADPAAIAVARIAPAAAPEQ
jgi:hypothetical protein